MATLGFKLEVEGLEENALVVRSFDGQESLSDDVFHGEACYGFRYYLNLASRQSDFTPEQLVDKTAELTFYRNGELVQRVNGVVRSFTQGDIGHNYTFYSLTLVPALERLSLRQNSRIFQLKTVPEIISVLLQEMGIDDYAFSVKRTCAQREFCVQYRETDLAFLQRLAAEEGLVYSFIHEEGKHTVLFTDSTASLPKLGGEIAYNSISGGVVDTPYVSSLIAKTEMEVSSTALQDYSFKKPTNTFAQSAQGTDMDYQQAIYEHFDSPGRFKDDTNGQAFNQIRLEYLRRNARTLDGKSNQPKLRAGYQFTLAEHLNDTMNTDYLVVRIRHQGEQSQALEEEAGSGSTRYANQFKLVPSTVNWQAKPQPKPQVDGPMMAMVVGPEDEEIFCDKYGRVKIHFPWDRYSNADDQSSCWVRVSHGWAGSQYGMVAIPRIGHEVIVSFLNGDPDQPIITGRTYHETNIPPYTLPDNKTKTVIRTQTHQGDTNGYNELSFEDQADSEKIYMHAQKDFEAQVNNDHTDVIHNDKHLTVDNDSFTKIGKNKHLTVKGESRTKVTKNMSEEVGTSNIASSDQYKIGTLMAVQAGKTISISSGAKLVVEAGSEITLTNGSNFVKVDASGVTIQGSVVNLNAGGSASAATAYGGSTAVLPGKVDAPPTDPKAILTPAQVATMKSAAPFCEECEKCKEGACSA
ncbi:type VI secretion system Vgr family protein [Vibrio nitrifigilis]|uniref:Type VI secretion system tip protein VgrG n=1 Tax=Vibrio nitrifigilis TaxID=2789781 RepID=A0ABS0GLH7_9VIBR|nr:type VI secretion system tip protein VgrG [Vibrio nitrifigilis]MBF9003331.1 type VI secretion system tip protein VgrG [Vibrio nitrifigilis]